MKTVLFPLSICALNPANSYSLNCTHTDRKDAGLGIGEAASTCWCTLEKGSRDVADWSKGIKAGGASTGGKSWVAIRLFGCFSALSIDCGVAGAAGK